MLKVKVVDKETQIAWREHLVATYGVNSPIVKDWIEKDIQLDSGKHPDVYNRMKLRALRKIRG